MMMPLIGESLDSRFYFLNKSFIVLIMLVKDNMNRLFHSLFDDITNSNNGGLDIIILI